MLRFRFKNSGYAALQLLIGVFITAIMSTTTVGAYSGYITFVSQISDEMTAANIETVVKCEIALDRIKVDQASKISGDEGEIIKTIAYKLEGGQIPRPKQNDLWFFYLDNKTYKVSAKGCPDMDDIVLK